MKAIKFSILLYTFISFATACFASPSIYITTRWTQGGLFKLNMDTSQAERIDTYSADHDFTTLGQYGSNHLLAASYAGTNALMIFNEDGSLATEYETVYNSVGAIEKPNSDGDIYYAQYTQATVQLLDIQTGTSTTVRSTGFGYAWQMALRSNGEVYVAEWSGTRMMGIDSGTTISSSGWALFLEADDYGNLYKNNGYNIIQKINQDNTVSTFWSDSNIALYNLAYDHAEDVFYGLAKDNSTGLLNLYQFDLMGNMSLYLSNITGLTGGYNGNPPQLYSNMIVLSNDIATVIPEPASLILLALGGVGILCRKFKSLK